MATRNEEYIAVAGVLISLVIFSIFFGVFWSFLLVFTFLLLAYFSRPPQTKKKITTRKYKIKQESLDNSLDESEYLSNGGKDMDVPFTGLPSPKFPTQTLRSPMPLLSSLTTVTKRLSFNVSSLTSPDGQIYTLGNASRRLNTTIGSPRQSPMSPISSPQTTKYFSLINPSLQQPSTVKIAIPEIDNRTITIDKPKKSADSSLSRATILSALKQSTIRKRSVVEDEDGGDDVSSPVENHKKKRRYHYPSSKTPTTEATDLEITRDIIPEPPSVTRNNTGVYSLIQTRLKRLPLRNDDNNTSEEAVVMLKKTRQDYDSKTTGLSEFPETADPKYEDTRAVQATSSVVNTESYDDDNDSGCDADDDDDIVMKTVLSTTGTQRLSKKQAQKLAEKRKRIEMKASSTPSHTPKKSSSSRTPSNTPDLPVSRQQRLSKKQRTVNTPAVSEITTSTNDSPASEKSDVSGQEMSPRKRFTVLRFPSRKNEAKRRPVPVYCASVNSPDLPKHRSITHKITKEDIELDRKMTRQRVLSLLDGSDDEEEEEKEKSKGASPSVAIHVTTCMPTPSRLQTVAVTTTSGIPSTSSLVSGKSSESQDAAVSTSQSTSATSTGTTQPSTLLSALAASKPSEMTPLSSVSTQSTISLPGTADPKSSIFSQGTFTASGTQVPNDQASVSSSTLSTTTQGFSLTATSSNATHEPSATTIGPVKILFGAPTSDPAKTATLTSFTTSSQSVQTPICTPIVQNLLGTNPTFTTPGVPATTAPASALNLGSAISQPPQISSNTSNNLPQTGFNLPQPGSGVSSNLTGFSAPSNLLRTGPSTASGLTTFSAATTAPQTELKSSLLQTGFNTSSNFPQPEVSTTSSLPKFNFSATTPAGQNPASLTTAATRSMFSGLNANTAGSTLQNVTQVTTQASQSGYASAGGFSFSASTAPKTTSQGSAFTFGASQQTAAPKTTTQTSTFSFGTQQSAAPSPFGSQPGTSSNASTAPNITTQASTFRFGVSQQPAAPSPFGSQLSTTKGFSSTTSSNLFGAQPSTTSSTPAFGFASSTSQSTFGNTGTTPIPGGFKFGANTATPSGFGNATQQAATKSAPSGQFSFSAGAPSTPNQSQNKTGFSFAAGANPASTSQPFGAPSSQRPFGAGANTNVFGAGATQTPLGASTNPGVFGSPATNQANQNAFGSTPSAFGSPAPQNVFGNPAESSGTGGFKFGGGGGGTTSTPSSGGFKFGATASSGFQSTPNSAPAFGSAPSATPAASAVGFNFGAGSTSGTPAFGGGTPSAGGFSFGAGNQSTSSSVAKPRPKATARRRTRK